MRDGSSLQAFLLAWLAAGAGLQQTGSHAVLSAFACTLLGAGRSLPKFHSEPLKMLCLLPAYETSIYFRAVLSSKFPSVPFSFCVAWRLFSVI